MGSHRVFKLINVEDLTNKNSEFQQRQRLKETVNVQRIYYSSVHDSLAYVEYNNSPKDLKRVDEYFYVDNPYGESN